MRQRGFCPHCHKTVVIVDDEEAACPVCSSTLVAVEVLDD